MRFCRTAHIDGKEARFAYNKAGELAEMVDWNGTTEFTLDKLGQITKATDHAGNVTSFAYDGLDRLVKTTGHEAQKVKKQEFSYDSLGNLVRTVFEKNKNQSYVTQEYAYDAANRMVKGTNKDGEQSHYVFKDYALDFTKPLKNVIMETESRDGRGPADDGAVHVLLGQPFEVR
ncbi:MAG: hypothetical protein FWG53_11545 [Clostridiales bacterium]|nr:hypothetical protein [Clostridiales bacterium]